MPDASPASVVLRLDADGQLGRPLVTASWERASTTWAAKAQLGCDSDDMRLLELARVHHRTCLFWWGRLIDGTTTRAHCYVCGERLSSFPSQNPLSDHQRERILKHRREHLARLAPSVMAVGDKP